MVSYKALNTKIEFTEYNSYRKYPEKLRLVKFYDEEQGREFTFLTNDFYLTSAIIAYCLVAIVQHDLQLKRSTYEVLQILSISLMEFQQKEISEDY